MPPWAMNVLSVAGGLGLGFLSISLLLRQTSLVQPNPAVRFVIAPAYTGQWMALPSRNALMFAIVGFVISFIAWTAATRFVLGAVGRSHRITMYLCMLVFSSLWVLGAVLAGK